MGATVGRPKRMAGKVPDKPKTVGIRVSAEYAAWLDEAVEHCRTDIAKLIDAALAEYVKARGFEKRPPRRMP